MALPSFFACFFLTFAAYVRKTQEKMESDGLAIDADHFHIRNRRQHYRICCKKTDELIVGAAGLAVGHSLYSSCYHSLAACCYSCQHSFWTVFFFFPIYPENRNEDGPGQ